MENLDNILKNIKPPRELCKRCFEWDSYENVGPHDIPGCPHNVLGTKAHSYIVGERDDCPEFNEY